MATERKWAECLCPDCEETPTPDEHGLLKRSCGQTWTRELSVKGSSEEEIALTRLGFQEAKDIDGNLYYVLPAGAHIVNLYADGTWYSDKAAPGSALKDYLLWIEAALAECKLMPH
jgi:hypothetical protein